MEKDMIETFTYIRYPYSYDGGWESEVFFDSQNNVLSSERKCYIDALIKYGVTDVPFDDLSLDSLEMICLSNNIYVLFLEDGCVD